MDLVDRAFIMWERINQPRRARARLFADETPTVCALPKVGKNLENATTPLFSDLGFSESGPLSEG